MNNKILKKLNDKKEKINEYINKLEYGYMPNILEGFIFFMSFCLFWLLIVVRTLFLIFNSWLLGWISFLIFPILYISFKLIRYIKKNKEKEKKLIPYLKKLRDVENYISILNNNKKLTKKQLIEIKKINIDKDPECFIKKCDKEISSALWYFHVNK